jgi:Zn-dependent protease
MGWSDREGSAAGGSAVVRSWSASATAALAAASAAPFFDGQLPAHGIALVIAFLIISLGIHEAAHGWVALQCGDPTARDLGRITLNPIAHIDPFMTVILPTVLALSGGMIFGGAKPVPVTYARLRHPLRDMALVALAGPLSNLLLAIVFLVAQKAALAFGGYERGQLLPLVLEYCVLFNLLLTVFNLLPIPPLDGSRVMAWLLPEGLREPYVALERIGLILVIALVMLVRPVNTMLSGAIAGLWGALEALTGGSWR